MTVIEAIRKRDSFSTTNVLICSARARKAQHSSTRVLPFDLGGGACEKRSPRNDIVQVAFSRFQDRGVDDVIPCGM